MDGMTKNEPESRDRPAEVEMTAFEALMNLGTLGEYKARARGRTKHPRDVAIQWLEDNITFLHDPSHRVKGGVLGMRPPPACFEVLGDVAAVFVRYNRRKLSIAPGKNVLNVPVHQIESALRQLILLLKEGHFDAEIQEIATEVGARRMKHRRPPRDR